VNLALSYPIVLQWSKEDQAYLASVPALPGCITHGDSYEHALQNVLEVAERWLAAAQKAGKPIPPSPLVT